VFQQVFTLSITWHFHNSISQFYILSIHNQ